MGFPRGSSSKESSSVQETQEMWIWSLGQEGPLEEGMENHSSIHAWSSPGTEEPGMLQSMGLKQLDMAEATEHSHT